MSKKSRAGDHHVGRNPCKSFHFDLGNSVDGPLGLCARIQAVTREGALLKLKTALSSLLRGTCPQDYYGSLYDDTDGFASPPPVEGLEYIHIHINSDYITEAAIDSVDEPADVEDE